MRNTIAKSLAPLASLSAQRRFIVHGTRDEYLVPSELLNNADDVIRQIRTMPVARDSLSADTAQAIVVLGGLLDAARDSVETSDSNEELIERDDAWRTVREHVARCLDIMGFDLREWEQTEGVSHEG